MMGRQAVIPKPMSGQAQGLLSLEESSHHGQSAAAWIVPNIDEHDIESAKDVIGQSVGSPRVTLRGLLQQAHDELRAGDFFSSIEEDELSCSTLDFVSAHEAAETEKRFAKVMFSSLTSAVQIGR